MATEDKASSLEGSLVTNPQLSIFSHPKEVDNAY